METACGRLEGLAIWSVTLPAFAVSEDLSNFSALGSAESLIVWPPPAEAPPVSAVAVAVAVAAGVLVLADFSLLPPPQPARARAARASVRVSVFIELLCQL